MLYRAKRTAFEEGLSAEWDSVDGLYPEEDGHPASVERDQEDGPCCAGLEKRTR